jgi:hypothetical protein
MHRLQALRILCCSALLGALGCGTDAANASVCPNLPLYYAEKDESGEYTGRFLDPITKEPLTQAQLDTINTSNGLNSKHPDQRCTTPIGTALTDPNAPPPTSGGGGGSSGADAG